MLSSEKPRTKRSAGRGAAAAGQRRGSGAAAAAAARARRAPRASGPAPQNLASARSHSTCYQIYYLYTRSLVLITNQSFLNPSLTFGAETRDPTRRDKKKDKDKAKEKQVRHGA